MLCWFHGVYVLVVFLGGGVKFLTDSPYWGPSKTFVSGGGSFDGVTWEGHEYYDETANIPYDLIPSWLVVEPTHLTNMLVKLDHETPTFGVNICLLDPPLSKFLTGYQWLLDLRFACSVLPQTVVVSWWFSMRRICKQSPSIQIQDFYLVPLNTKTPNIWVITL